MLGITIIAALALTSAPQAPEQDNPVVALVKSSVKDTSKPFTLTVRMKVKAGENQKFEEAFAKLAKESRKETGCRAYHMNRGTKEPNVYLVYERWANLAALEAHMRAAYFLEAVEKTGPMTDGPADLAILVPVGD